MLAMSVYAWIDKDPCENGSERLMKVLDRRGVSCPYAKLSLGDFFIYSGGVEFAAWGVGAYRYSFKDMMIFYREVLLPVVRERVLRLTNNPVLFDAIETSTTTIGRVVPDFPGSIEEANTMIASLDRLREDADGAIEDEDFVPSFLGLSFSESAASKRSRIVEAVAICGLANSTNAGELFSAAIDLICRLDADPRAAFRSIARRVVAISPGLI